MTIYPMQGSAPYYTNNYLVVSDSGSAALIDAEVTPEQVRAALVKSGGTLKKILLTHGHFDHVGNLQPLRDTFGAEVWMSAQDSLFFKLQADRFYSEGEAITMDEACFIPYATPGHTPGSTCIRCGEVLFSGDTLFCGDVGRTDLAGGDADALAASLAKLCRVIDCDLQVLPGHEEFSSFETEKQTNPWLRRALQG